MNKYYFGNPDGVNFNTLIDMSNIYDFSKIDCSTVKLLDYWRDYEKVLSVIKENLGVLINNYKICFEYPVKSIGRAKASFTDIMIFTDDYLLGIEAKYKENRYDSCRKWIDKGKNSDIREKVLNHWIGIMNKNLDCKIELNDIMELEYQLIHRTASVCYEKRNKYYVLYQKFYKGNEAKLKQKEDLKKLKNIIKNNKIRFAIQFIKFKDSEHYENIKASISNDLNIFDKSEIIKSILKNKSLIEVLNDNEFVIL